MKRKSDGPHPDEPPRKISAKIPKFAPVGKKQTLGANEPSKKLPAKIPKFAPVKRKTLDANEPSKKLPAKIPKFAPVKRTTVDANSCINPARKRWVIPKKVDIPSNFGSQVWKSEKKPLEVLPKPDFAKSPPTGPTFTGSPSGFKPATGSSKIPQIDESFSNFRKGSTLFEDDPKPVEKEKEEDEDDLDQFLEFAGFGETNNFDESNDFTPDGIGGEISYPDPDAKKTPPRKPFLIPQYGFGSENAGNFNTQEPDEFDPPPMFQPPDPGKMSFSNSIGTMMNEDNKKLSSSFGLAQLKKFGYVEGEGLGKTTKGPAHAIEVHQRLDPSAGLGYDKSGESGMKVRTHKYKKIEFKVHIQPTWCVDCPREPVTEEELTKWFQMEPKVDEIRPDNITYEQFGSKELQVEIIESKARFDHISSKIFRDARNKANPFEAIKNSFFQNRAALKMCELDAIYRYAFSRPKSNKTFSGEKPEKFKPGCGKSCWSPEFLSRESFFFADICGGPGGFSEYLLHMHKWGARGFGITLGNVPEDWDFRKFNINAPHDTFTTNYGKDGTGDITKTNNIRHFIEYVRKGTGNRGVDVAMADGGFDVSQDYKSQELLSKHLIFCEILIGMGILKKGGTFVIKLFDCYLPHTCSYLYIARTYFEKFSICKPNQSRPANSERYVVFSGLKESNPKIMEQLFHINNMMIETMGTSEMVAPLVPLNEMDPQFKMYVKEFNERNAKRQIAFLNRIEQYIEDKSLITDDQRKIMESCLKFWYKYPDGKPRVMNNPHYGKTFVAPVYVDGRENKIPLDKMLVMGSNKKSPGSKLHDAILFELNPKKQMYGEVSKHDISKNGLFSRHPLYRWRAIMFKKSLSPKRVILLIDHRHKIFEIPFEVHQNRRDRWTVPQAQFINRIDLNRLPVDSVLDCVKTTESSQGSQNDSNVKVKYHLVDAWVLGSKSIYTRKWTDRAEMCRIFCMNLASTGIPIKYTYPKDARGLLQRIEERMEKKDDLYIVLTRVYNAKGIEPQRPLKSRYWHKNIGGGFPFRDLAAKLL